MRPFLALAVAAGLLAAPSAEASTLVATPDPRDPSYQTFVVYTAAPGEANDVVATRIDDYSMRVADPGAVIRASGGCRSLDSHTAVCASRRSSRNGPGWMLTLQASSGDRDDEIHGEGVGLDANGGAGDDLLVVNANIASRLNGGGGHDRLVGGNNLDVLIDGDRSGATDSDLLDGGPGDTGDRVSYSTRTGAVRVDLGAGRSGERGEGDQLTSVESAVGGRGDDRLVAAATGSYLVGGPGADRLAGREGSDSLDGGRGKDVLIGAGGDDGLDAGKDAVRDLLSGGVGDDTLYAGRGGDRLLCGAGSDDVGGGLRDGLVEASCERATFNFEENFLSLAPNPEWRSRRAVSFTGSCPEFDELDGGSYAIAGGIVLRERSGARTVLGRGRIPRRQGARCGEDGYYDFRVRTALTPLGARLAARPHGVLVAVHLSGRNLPSVTWCIRLRRGALR